VPVYGFGKPISDHHVLGLWISPCSYGGTGADALGDQGHSVERPQVTRTNDRDAGREGDPSRARRRSRDL
jgi:hypothetical protein